MGGCEAGCGQERRETRRIGIVDDGVGGIDGALTGWIGP
jgi:hypothetical protein